MTEVPKPERPLQEHELCNFWYGVLNHVDPEESKYAFNFLIECFSEDGYTLENLIDMSEKASPMVRSMCYDALKRGEKQITQEQENFLKENRWQDKFWG